MGLVTVYDFRYTLTPMRIATYNLYEGAKDSYPLIDFIQKQAVDVLCIQEANGWQSNNFDRVRDFARQTGLDHYVFGDSHTEYKLATFSKSPITSLAVAKAGYWHCAVQATVAYRERSLDIWNVHLNPQDEASRLNEAEALIAGIGGDTIIIGDMNSLSSDDLYPTTMMAGLVDRGITKFGTTGLRYDVTDHFKNSGLIDVAAALGVIEPTAPTPANTDAYHAFDMRLDYMFVTRSLNSAIEHVECVKSNTTDSISDHYPVILTLR
jgi:exodeoxyribonuclease-3